MHGSPDPFPDPRGGAGPAWVPGGAYGFGFEEYDDVVDDSASGCAGAVDPVDDGGILAWLPSDAELVAATEKRAVHRPTCSSSTRSPSARVTRRTTCWRSCGCWTAPMPGPRPDARRSWSRSPGSSPRANRADALAARVLGTVDADGSVSWDRAAVPVHVEVVIDLETLRGEADHLTLLNGSPTPAQVGREPAELATWWTRVVTDPVDGHLLDYGHAYYLPPKLRRFAKARDGGCRIPVCGTSDERRTQMDHALAFPEGASSAGNTGMLCTTCHQLKTAGRTHITDSKADGSMTWTTAWGQTIHVPARQYLRDPAYDPPAGPRPASAPMPPPDETDDPPPF